MHIKKGVTLIELIVAITIIGILGLFSFQLISFETQFSANQQKKKDISAVKNNIRNVFSLITNQANSVGEVLNVEENKVSSLDNFLIFDDSSLNYNNQLVYQIAIADFTINVSYESHLLNINFIIQSINYTDNYYLVREINELP
jgi:prepilin-type N-terminal cleavage/methylation domain-containing protein